ncbi:MAG: hypothetical protein UT32_C0027G0010 [Parcubacteria group bacterium GW2011_GWC2_39_14]|nr:MAG: hypothetical protein UT32_C0027G0010 [Parcubacteria group bacterium GW2011_GWC2_39_14]
MYQHPAHRMQFEDLLVSLCREVEGNNVVEVPGPDGLALFNYTRHCTYSCSWNEINVLARGLVLDLANRRIVATPFAKFFNLFERGHSIPNLPFEVFEKIDGSLGILFFHNHKWYIVTRGSFYSPPTVWGKEWLDKNVNQDLLDRGSTYLVEIVCVETHVVVSYKYEACVLLGAFDNSGFEWERVKLEVHAAELGMRIAGSAAYESVDAIIEIAKKLGRNQEGFVVRFSDGARIKIKGKEYCTFHKMVSGVNPIGIWELMEQGSDLDQVKQALPEEFWGDFDQIRRILETRRSELLQEVEAEFLKWKGKPDSELGKVIKTLPERVSRLIFARRKLGPDFWKTERNVKHAVYRQIRPTGNHLLGYDPSMLMLRCLTDNS